MTLTLPDRNHLAADIARDSLRDFIPMAWPIIEPGKRYKSNWHIDAIAEHLEAVTRGELRRLIVNIPPRHMKSSLIAVLWPMWMWLRAPQTQWLFVSYGEKLSKRDSLKSRRLVESMGGRNEGGTLVERVGYHGLLRLLGDDWTLAKDQNEKLRFENTQAGYRLATSFGGTATGEGGDIIVIDDPHKADEVESEVERENVIEFIDGTLSTRHNDPDTGVTVLVMQRLHEDDATGHLLEHGGYTHLCLPAEYEPTHPFVWPGDKRTKPGELLWPDHFTADALGDIKKMLGSYRAAGQLQQRPAPAEGGIFRTAWWRYWNRDLYEQMEGNDVSGLPHFTRLWQSWDTAMTEKTDADYTVGQLWGRFGVNAYLLRQARGRWSYPEVLTQMKGMTAWAAERWPKFGTHSIYVENAAMGGRILQAGRREIPGLIAVNVGTRDKVQRAHAVTPQIEGGNVLLPGAANSEQTGPAPDTPGWVQELIAECAAFPNVSNDDQVDTLTQALDPLHQPRDGGKPKSEDRWGKGKSITGGMKAWDV